MLGAFGRAFRTPDLRQKLLFTITIMIVFRIGSAIPSPGVSYSNVQACISGNTGTNELLGIANLFSGGALLQLSIFALGIMPYITASIIMQLMRVISPRFEALHKEGQTGQTKTNQYTRYVTIGLAILQASTFVTLAKDGRLFPGCTSEVMPGDGIAPIIFTIIAMTAGAALTMWMGEMITERGVGNGMSLLIFTSIAAQFPVSLGAILTERGWATFIAVMVIGIAVMVLVIFVEQSQRRVPVQYAKRMVGRRLLGGSSTYIPIKVNMAGVIPVIFASSLLAIPGLAATFSPTSEWSLWIQANFVRGDHPVYIALYVLLIIFFAFFYVSITFNPEEIADNMKKHGGFVPGIRAGRATAEYLQYVLNRVLTPGALYLGAIAVIPLVALAMISAQQNFPFGGTSILIVVGVGLETIKQIDAQLQQRHYEGILK